MEPNCLRVRPKFQASRIFSVANICSFLPAIWSPDTISCFSSIQQFCPREAGDGIDPQLASRRDLTGITHEIRRWVYPSTYTAAAGETEARLRPAWSISQISNQLRLQRSSLKKEKSGDVTHLEECLSSKKEALVLSLAQHKNRYDTG